MIYRWLGQGWDGEGEDPAVAVFVHNFLPSRRQEEKQKKAALLFELYLQYLNQFFQKRAFRSFGLSVTNEGQTAGRVKVDFCQCSSWWRWLWLTDVSFTSERENLTSPRLHSTEEKKKKLPLMSRELWSRWASGTNWFKKKKRSNIQPSFRFFIFISGSREAAPHS